MGVQCGQEDCTVVETGVCLLNNDPSTCPQRSEPGDVGGDVPPVEGAKKAPIPRSRAYGVVEARALMASRYVHVVGILGEPNAGKTACLVSLYLLLARNKLSGFTFGDSRTLMAFEEISRGARRWNEGQLPDQLTAHTELADDRTAGFLHIRAKSVGRVVDIDLLLPDLPGEWTSALIERNRVDRLQFLRRADTMWLMVDGAELTAPETRQGTLHRTRLLIQRLADFLNPSPPVILVVTRSDQCTADQGAVADLCNEGNDHGLNMKVIPIASVSDDEAVESGHGIADLIRSTIREPRGERVLWPNFHVKATFTPPRVRLVRGAKN